ncbi:6-pyruvoyl trahydropterin synthase family protein [Saccharospirillum mangrovi]|uniref:6-pyruvoyl trahydropterin synthase family protein n=1 Tax=Saccharospirillum mangrovi TaxID=2161747 RepID=UPI000D358E24|nr:6-carboxytetrahydropterin synthase [Saccharospirillum mangrovi]
MSRLFVDHLTVLDFSYLHPHRGVVGESWIVDVELEGDLNDEGMVFDFGHVKKLLKQALDGGMDHTFVVPLALPGLTLTETDDGERLDIEYRDANGQLKLRYQAPREAVFQLDSASVSIEAARPALEAHLNTLVPANVRKVHLRLHTEQIDGAFYHYAHGLKKHQGDCQRLCHGHRSRLEIWRDGERDTEAEQDWAQRFADVYLVTREDRLASAEPGLTHVGYDAEQGRFDVWLSDAQCYEMTTDTTVELIAAHLAAELGREQPQHQWRVKAFEGVRKGAIAESRS